MERKRAFKEAKTTPKCFSDLNQSSLKLNLWVQKFNIFFLLQGRIFVLRCITIEANTPLLDVVDINSMSVLCIDQVFLNTVLCCISDSDIMLTYTIVRKLLESYVIFFFFPSLKGNYSVQAFKMDFFLTLVMFWEF